MRTYTECRLRIAAFYDGALSEVVERRFLGQRDVGRHSRDDNATFETVLQIVEDGLLHHISDFVAFEGGTDEADGTHRRDDVIGRNVLLLQTNTT